MRSNYQSLYVNLIDRKRSSSLTASGNFLHKSLLVVAIFMLIGGALGKVYLDNQTKKLVLQWQQKHEKLNILKKESENMAIEQERYMNGNYILIQAERLNLRPSDPGQVRMMKDAIQLWKTRHSRDTVIASR